MTSFACPKEGPAIFTVGHSTRALEAFAAMLRANAIDVLMDVRTVPRSRHNPQYSRDALTESLPGAGIAYQHEGALGGLRKTTRDSINGAWRNASFRGYADYMQTPEFGAALESVIELARRQRVALMCAEGNPFRCHRSLIADALIARHIAVCEITASGHAKPHRLTAFARVEDERVTYPPEPEGDTTAG